MTSIHVDPEREWESDETDEFNDDEDEASNDIDEEDDNDGDENEEEDPLKDSFSKHPLPNPPFASTPRPAVRNLFDDARQVVPADDRDDAYEQTDEEEPFAIPMDEPLRKKHYKVSNSMKSTDVCSGHHKLSI